MVFRMLGLALTGAALAACSGMGGHPVRMADRPQQLADGIYAGYWGRVSNGDARPDCPNSRPGTLEIGDNTLSLATDQTTIFVVPLPAKGQLHAVAAQTTLDGTRDPDGDMVFTTTSPTCTMRFAVRYLPGF